MKYAKIQSFSSSLCDWTKTVEVVKDFLLTPFLYLSHTYININMEREIHTQTHTHIFRVMAIVATMSNYSIGKKFSDFVFTTNK